MSRQFTWNAWDYDCDGEAYIISKDECQEKTEVPTYICKVDNISEECKSDMNVQEGWCRWEVISDWENGDGEPRGWYVIYDKKVLRSFPIWIVKKEEWY